MRIRAAIYQQFDADYSREILYIGFTINWYPITTAVENKETAREEWCKKIALWRVDAFINALRSM